MSTLRAMRPVISSIASIRAVDPRRLRYFLHTLTVCMLIVSFFAEGSIAYLCITISVLIPCYLWIYSGAFGIPVLPVISTLFYLYYAMPLLLGNTLKVFRPSDLIWAALSVGLFLTAASLAAWPFMGVIRNKARPSSRSRGWHIAQSIKQKSIGNLAANDELHRLIYVGFFGGIVFDLAATAGKLAFLGSTAG